MDKDVTKIAGILLGEDLYKSFNTSLDGVRDLFPDEAEDIARTILKALNQKSEGIAEAMMDKPDECEGCAKVIEKIKTTNTISDTCRICYKQHHQPDADRWTGNMASGRFDLANVKEPSPEVKVYKLSEMWKVWYSGGRDGVIYHILFNNIVDARRAISSLPTIAITPADATEFYEGQGLENC